MTEILLKGFDKTIIFLAASFLLPHVVTDFVLESVHSGDLLVNDGFDWRHKRHVGVASQFLDVGLVLSNLLLQLRNVVFEPVDCDVRFVDYVAHHRL